MRTIKKISLLTTLFVFSGLFFTSCKKCSHCTVTNSSGTVIKDYGEKCGTSSDVKNYENSSKNDAVQYGGTFNCGN